MTTDRDDTEALQLYCDRDVLAEEAASLVMPPMTDAELRFWQIDQEINWRGVRIDIPAVKLLVEVVERHLEKSTAEFRELTGLNPTQTTAIATLLGMSSLTEEAVSEALERDDLSDRDRRILELRAETASASVKKLYAMLRYTSADGRCRGLYNHHGARTGRPTGGSVQPTNMPKAGPDVRWCGKCGKPSGAHHDHCAWACGGELSEVKKWNWRCVDFALEAGHAIPWVFRDTLLTVSGCLRGMFIADPGNDLISSDFTAIEAVVLAALAGEQWRLDTFERGDDIYLASISRITGTSMETYVEYERNHGEHHGDRAHGKVAELSGGFGGWIGAWRAFGAEGDDAELRQKILAWREASPAIVEFWGGQFRGLPWDQNRYPELYGLEGMFLKAWDNPGLRAHVGQISFQRFGNAIWMMLPSGREIAYHNVRIDPSDRDPAARAISYEGWNTNPKSGPVGWIRMRTWGSKIAENATQAVAHDIQRHSIELLEENGYLIVLHTYDENTAEVPEDYGSIEEFERLMTELPTWAEGWPIRAAGGWRGKRYRKG